MAVPLKYRALGDFHEYYSGARVAPYLTVFIGGNHEASNHLYELYYGGWVAPQIYYMGAASVIRCGPLRIAGISGIWKGYNYRKAHFERLPYSQDDIRSIYHVRELDVRKLLQIRTQVDVGLSHDWPNGIEWKGRWKQLFQFKKHLEPDAKKNCLGSIAAKYLLEHLRPPHWFSAHLHCKYSAVVRSTVKQPFDGKTGGARDEPSDSKAMNGSSGNTDEIDLDLESGDEQESTSTAKAAGDSRQNVSDDLRARLPDSFKVSSQPKQALPSVDIPNATTNFLALDKCLPNKRFLQLLNVESFRNDSDTPSAAVGLRYDKEWLAITRVFAEELQLGKGAVVPKDRGAAQYRSLIEAQEKWVEDNLVKQGKMNIPENFVQTAPSQMSKDATSSNTPKEHPNPQTAAFCELIGIRDAFAPA